MSTVTDDNETPPSSTNSSEAFPDTSSEPDLTPSYKDDAPQLENVLKKMNLSAAPPEEFIKTRKRRASTMLISQNGADIRRLIGDGETGTKLLEKVCCGGGCCFLQKPVTDLAIDDSDPIEEPDNPAYRSLNLKLGSLAMDSDLTNVMPLPLETISFAPVPPDAPPYVSTVQVHPPSYVTPHPPYEVFSSKLHHARELTKEGAEKTTYHFDLDVTDYPEESGDVDFVVGGAVGICAPNQAEMVDELFDLLCVPRFVRDKQVVLNTTTGRWPTIWGDEKPRQLITTRRELLTWCSDIQSYPPTKSLLRLLAEFASAENEKKILTYLVSAQGQSAFCDLRTSLHLTINQLLQAFPSSRPPLTHLLSNLQQLMPRFYSLSADPYVSCPLPDTDTTTKPDLSSCRRLIEIAVSVQAGTDFLGRPTRGVGSGFLERCAQTIISGTQQSSSHPPDPTNIRIPLFRGLMSNPLAKEFVSDGPLLLIGAGVGVAPFRGFVQRRLRNANCANKVWVLQGVRDSLKDELYSGEWGDHEKDVKRVVESRKGEGRYVQEEVVHQADLVWRIINALDGRVFVCGSGKGMGEGVERALVEVAILKGGLNKDGAESFWAAKKEGGQYIAETW